MSLRIKRPKVSVVREDLAFEHDEPDIKGTFTFGTIDNSYYNYMYISMHQLAQSNKPHFLFHTFILV
jgi:hypothetical protein